MVNKTLTDAHEFRYIHKNALMIDYSYQRPPSKTRARKIAREWDNSSCGVLTVSERNNEYYVIDGQHRLLAAKSLDRVEYLRCMVFKWQSVEEEAAMFLGLNSNRKLVSNYEKHQASIKMNDQKTIEFAEVLAKYGVVPTSSTANKPMHLKSLKEARNIYEEDVERFHILFGLLAELCTDSRISDVLLRGLNYLHQHCCRLDDKRFRSKILAHDARALEDAASDHGKIFGNQAPAWAKGILELVNHKAKKRYELSPFKIGK